jgi:hypothetical protein
MLEFIKKAASLTAVITSSDLTVELAVMMFERGGVCLV